MTTMTTTTPRRAAWTTRRTGGDGASQECIDFCTAYLGTCGDDPGNDYVDQMGCETACGDFDKAGLACRVMHTMLAEDNQGVHCPHASNDGAGVC